ncbi:hypothetical protein ABZ949_33980 [Micromonospora tulbaghiae]
MTRTTIVPKSSRLVDAADLCKAADVASAHRAELDEIIEPRLLMGDL